jgi:hypothetical protein
MKTVEIDIDHTDSPRALAREFKAHNLQKGDHLRLLSSKVDNNALFELAIIVLAIIAINMINENKIQYADKLLKDVFNDKDIKDIKNDIRATYDIDLIIGTKDGEQQIWNQFGKSKLAKAYDDIEPEYDISMVKEPNPHYKNESR